MPRHAPPARWPAPTRGSITRSATGVPLATESQSAGRPSPKKGTVYLVGAGPGDPELLTLRAARLLAEADVVFYDDLVPEAVLELCGPRTLRTSVGKRCGRARTTQAEIHTMMVDAARNGLSVVRLKSGDPLVFGRAAEELHALRHASIPVEVVPGVSAVFAAGAQLQVPLTDRRSASKLILIAGHHAADKTGRQPIWSGPLPHDATLAIYMPGRNAASVAKQLRAAGLPADLPCLAISRAATPQQEVRTSTLQKLDELTMPTAPVLLLAGYALQAPDLHSLLPLADVFSSRHTQRSSDASDDSK